MKVKVKIKLKNSKLYPRYMSEGSSGFDLKANIEEAITIEPGKWALIPTGLYVEIPKGFELQVRPRSSLALKGITVLNTPGTVDSDYRGEIKVILINLSNKPYTVSPGDRIAQGIISKVYIADFVEVEELTETRRGEGGFGSTGRV